MSLHIIEYPKHLFDVSQDVGELDKENTEDDTQDKCPDHEALRYSYSDFLFGSCWFYFEHNSSFDYVVEF